ncbi:MAG: SCO1664 family protein [Actinomycetota bacterium]
MADTEHAFDLAVDELEHLLAEGDIEIEGRMPHSSNATFLVTVTGEGDERPCHKAIYKPGRGERPLWDFPPDLYKREVATYRLAAALGWDVVPPTVIGSGPYGEGSVQAFVDADFAEHYFTLFEDGIGIDDFKLLCALDIIANNTDRKSGHCLLARNGRIYGIDHGLSFHAEFKLRTVIWEFADEPLGDDLAADITRFLDEGPPVELLTLLDPFERDAMLARAKALLDSGVFPADRSGGYRYPWPLV